LRILLSRCRMFSLIVYYRDVFFFLSAAAEKFFLYKARAEMLIHVHFLG